MANAATSSLSGGHNCACRFDDDARPRDGVRVGAKAPASSVPGAVEQVLDSYRAKGISDGVVLMIARNGVPIFRKAFGLVNREWGIANTPDAEFGVGSITKQFHGPSDPAAGARPEALARRPDLEVRRRRSPPSWRAITIRHLLTHTSGIPNHTSLPDWGAPNLDGSKPGRSGPLPARSAARKRAWRKVRVQQHGLMSSWASS